MATVCILRSPGAEFCAIPRSRFSILQISDKIKFIVLWQDVLGIEIEKMEMDREIPISRFQFPAGPAIKQ